MNAYERIRMLDAIARDMANDAESFDGKPFTGRTVGEYFGNHGAAIAVLAKTLKELVVAREKEEQDRQNEQIRRAMQNP